MAVEESVITYNLNETDKVFISKLALVNNIEIGRFSYVGDGTILSGPYKITIGKFTSIGQNCYAWTAENHQTKYISTYPFSGLDFDVGYPDIEDKNGEIEIGNDVWFGRGVRLLPGVKIADGCVVGTHAVVTKDLTEPYGVYVGVPAKFVKRRCPERLVQQLLEIKWWEWPLDKIKRNKAFFNTEVGTFDGNLKDLIVP